jgi:hypothetical protein
MINIESGFLVVSGKIQTGRKKEKSEGKMDITTCEKKRFGATAVEKGFLTVDQLVDALKIQAIEEIEKGKHRLIGTILFEQGHMTIPQIDEIFGPMTVLSAY